MSETLLYKGDCLHKNRQERCHPLGWLMNCRNYP